MARDLFKNLGSTTVPTGGTTAPTAGTTESWTVTSSSTFPAASNAASPATQFYVADPAAPSEVILVTNVSGTTWSVTRGADSTTPVTHTAGFTVRNVVPSTWLQELEDRINLPSFNVLEYGADKTGASDSTTGITAAITAAGTFAASYGSAKVTIPPGKYLIQGSVVFGSSQSNIVIEAYGAYIYGGTDYHTTGNLMFNAGGSTGYTTGPSNITVLGGIWDAKGQSCPASTSGQGDYQHRDIWCFGNGKNWRFEDMTFRNVPSWHGIDANSVDGLVIRNCRFEGFVDKSELGTRGDSEGIQLDTGGGGDPCINVCVVDCYSGPAIDGSGLATFGKLVGSHTPNVANTANHTKIRVANNYINGSGGAAIQGYDWDGATITGNIIESPSGDGIKIYGNSLGVVNRIVITGNIINSPSARGIYCSSSGGDGTGNGFTGCVINGNTISNCSSSPAIEIQAFNDSVIQGNDLLTLTTGHGIYARVCTDLLIGNNTIHGGSGMTAGSGMQVDAGTRCHIQGNKLREIADHGIYCSGVHTDVVVEDNFIHAAGRKTNLTPYGIQIGGSAHVNPTITGNLIRKFGSGNEATQAVHVTTASTGVVQYGNDDGGLGISDLASGNPSGVASRGATESKLIGSRSYGVSAAFTNNTTTQNAVTTSDQLSAGTYEVEVFCIFKCATVTPTTNIAFSTTGTVTSWSGMADWYTAATTVNSSAIQSTLTTAVAMLSPTSERIARYSGRLVLSAPGTLSFTMAVSAATTAPGTTIQPGTFMRITPTT